MPRPPPAWTAPARPAATWGGSGTTRRGATSGRGACFPFAGAGAKIFGQGLFTNIIHHWSQEGEIGHSRSCKGTHCTSRNRLLYLWVRTLLNSLVVTNGAMSSWPQPSKVLSIAHVPFVEEIICCRGIIMKTLTQSIFNYRALDPYGFNLVENCRIRGPDVRLC